MDKMQKILKNYPEIHIIKKKEIEPLSQLLTDRYFQEPLTRLQFLGFDQERGRELFLAQSRGNIEAFFKRKAVYGLEGGGGLLMGYTTEQIPSWQMVNVVMESGRYTRRILKKEDVDILKENLEYMEKINPGNWESNAAPKKRFQLLALTVEHGLKGTGAVRKLIMPFLDACDTLALPVTVSIYNPEYLPICQHFGFKVEEELESDLLDVKCYCLIRQPREQSSAL